MRTEGTKRKRTDDFEDLPEETICEIIATIDDPKYMTGPNVSIINIFGKIIMQSNGGQLTARKSYIAKRYF